MKLLPAAARDVAAAFPRQALHAQILGFSHPTSREMLEFRSELPSDIKLLLGNLECF